MTAQKILLVDDDEALRVTLSRALRSRGYDVYTAGDDDEAAGMVESLQPHFAVVDLKMPGKSGMRVLEEISLRSPQTRSIVLTGYGSIANAVEAMRLGAVNYVTKPADADQVIEAFEADRTTRTQLHRPSLAESEWNHIQKVLTDCDGNITHAARILDIPRRTLQRKLKKRAP